MNEDPGNFSQEVEKAHGENWRKWLGHLIDKPANGLELGTWKGESAAFMLGKIFTHRDSRYWCIDTFEGSDEHRLAGIDCAGLEAEARARLEPFGVHAQIFRSLSYSALRGFLRGMSFDFIYVDAAHDAMNVLRDTVFAFELLKPGGVLVWDDYEWTVFPDPADCPKLAIDAFLACYGREVEVIGMGWQVAVRRVR